ncbi:hypothetical protein JMJ77_0010913 [Colletotrichum scovillei]|uniref:Uncharacterized protein n=1 Tax=Colletotrichum scovillei TaxID=1209932 RepID=A0A9P7R3J0_9PEZI|nr:hypothetical protein JMJ77_0010913 [Colletotrichum scovillei]KAG7059903.1 hypothetical protein JMJ78_0015189 [Colletotrichum scovillei]KAG7067329.1 hypothetical protein JMJ76_0008769 [Colletotrichum scovillei]
MNKHMTEGFGFGGSPRSSPSREGRKMSKIKGYSLQSAICRELPMKTAYPYRPRKDNPDRHGNTASLVSEHLLPNLAYLRDSADN